MANEVKDFLKSSGFVIRPIGSSLSMTGKLGTFDIPWGSYKVKVYDGKEVQESALEHAESFQYESETYAAFARKLQDILLKNIELLLGAYDRGSDDRGILERYINKLDYLPNTSVDFLKLPNVLYVNDGDSDALFHLSRLMHVLSSGYQKKYSSGVVLLCHCPHLLVLFHIVSFLITQCEPPDHAFSFIPTAISPHISGGSFDSLVMIFKTADIDAAANSCMQSLKDSKGTKRWNSTMILVEESVESHLIQRLKRIMKLFNEGAPESSFSPTTFSPGTEKNVKLHVRSLRDSHGVTIIEPEGGDLTMGPIILTDVVPSVINDGTSDLGPLAYVFRFRTLKEAMSVVSHISNVRNNYVKLHSEAPGDAPLVAEIWSDSSSVVWRTSFHLSDCRISTIFVNPPYREKTRVIYEFFPGNSLFTYRMVPGAEANQKLLNDITSLLSSAKKAQEIWYSQGFDVIQEKMHILRSESSLKHIQGLSSALESPKYLMTKVHPVPVSSKNTKQGALFAARSWYLPVGPIITALQDTADENQPDVCILNMISALACGNSLLIILSNDVKNSRFTEIMSFTQKSLPQNLLQIYKCEFLDETSLPSVLSRVGVCGCYLPSEILKDYGVEGNKKSVYGSFPFLRRASIFWSLGGEIFSN
ncbi:hypothetical protein D915_010027 [Fasciola hepatica]|uniref:Aldehyde dehydrogenase domain-containing protein n=1 Tax=Fasciola hepatica TaxID=6192 RepID=A0A4E0RMW8_FASHE|nr:hypothetical protein D915_010027 [Fasciola hepatica]